MAPRSSDDTDFIISVDRDLLGDFTMALYGSGLSPHRVITDFMRCYVIEVRTRPHGPLPASMDDVSAHRKAVEAAYLELARTGIIPSFEVRTLARRLAAGEDGLRHPR